MSIKQSLELFYSNNFNRKQAAKAIQHIYGRGGGGKAKRKKMLDVFLQEERILHIRIAQNY